MLHLHCKTVHKPEYIKHSLTLYLLRDTSPRSSILINSYKDLSKPLKQRPIQILGQDVRVIVASCYPYYLEDTCLLNLNRNGAKCVLARAGISNRST